MKTADGGMPDELSKLQKSYELLGELSRDETITVYVARDRLSGNEVTIKVLRASDARGREALAHYASDARLLTALEHPNIVDVRSVKWLSENVVAVVTERVRGPSLRQVLDVAGTLPVARATEVLKGLARALAWAHSSQIMHRDVRPENVIFEDRTGRVVLSDFGLARRIETGPGDPSADAYRAPELVDGRYPDRRTDVYSLGIVGWELLTGRRPWPETMEPVAPGQPAPAPPPLAAVRPGLPPALVSAIEGAVQLDRDRRIADVTAFIDRLTGIAPPPRPTPAEKPGDTELAAEPPEWVALPVPRLPAKPAAAAAGTVAEREPEPDVDLQPERDVEQEPEREAERVVDVDAAHAALALPTAETGAASPVDRTTESVPVPAIAPEVAAAPGLITEPDRVVEPEPAAEPAAGAGRGAKAVAEEVVPAIEPIAEPEAEVVEATGEPGAERAVEPVGAPVGERVVEPAAEPVLEPELQRGVQQTRASERPAEPSPGTTARGRGEARPIREREVPSAVPVTHDKAPEARPSVSEAEVRAAPESGLPLTSRTDREVIRAAERGVDTPTTPPPEPKRSAESRPTDEAEAGAAAAHTPERIAPPARGPADSKRRKGQKSEARPGADAQSDGSKLQAAAPVRPPHDHAPRDVAPREGTTPPAGSRTPGATHTGARDERPGTGILGAAAGGVAAAGAGAAGAGAAGAAPATPTRGRPEPVPTPPSPESGRADAPTPPTRAESTPAPAAASEAAPSETPAGEPAAAETAGPSADVWSAPVTGPVQTPLRGPVHGPLFGPWLEPIDGPTVRAEGMRGGLGKPRSAWREPRADDPSPGPHVAAPLDPVFDTPAEFPLPVMPDPRPMPPNVGVGSGVGAGSRWTRRRIGIAAAVVLLLAVGVVIATMERAPDTTAGLIEPETPAGYGGDVDVNRPRADSAGLTTAPPSGADAKVGPGRPGSAAERERRSTPATGPAGPRGAARDGGTAARSATPPTTPPATPPRGGVPATTAPRRTAAAPATAGGTAATRGGATTSAARTATARTRSPAVSPARTWDERAEGFDRCNSPALADQRACISAHLARSDAGLNQTYNDVIAAMRRRANTAPGDPDPPEVQRLRAAQRSWLVRRDAECRRRGRGREGPLWAPTRAQCIEEFSVARSKELSNTLARLRHD